MATKTIDVTLATVHNTGTDGVAPKGALLARTVRAVDDEQIFQSENLYLIPPGGARYVPPGQSLTYNVAKRLTVSHFGEETEGHLNQMLVLHQDLTEDVVVSGRRYPDQRYQGQYNRKVRFDEINGFDAITCNYNVLFEGHFAAKIIVTYTVNLVSSSG